MPEATSKVCPHCGARNTPDAEACLACGTALVAPSDRITRPATEPLPIETQPTGRPVAPQPWPSSEQLFTLSGRYRLVYEIARGGMGVIYLAEDTLLDNLRVAIKLLPPQLAPELQAEKRLKREALTAMSLSHDNIVRLYSFDQHQGQNYLVMEYVNGPTLMELVTDRGPLPPQEVVYFIAAVCDGLHYAHEKGVVHRDVKPANVMLALPYDSPFVPPLAPRGATPEEEAASTDKGSAGTGSATAGHPGVRPLSALPRLPKRRESLAKMKFDDTRVSHIKICDFGIAQQLKATYTRLTGTNIIGSPVYMSPEQYRGDELDRRSDVYSLGATAYELFAARPPFDGPMHSLTYQILDKPAKAIDGLGEELNRVLLKSLEKKREDRWQSCQEFGRALRRAVGEEPSGYEPAVRVTPAEISARKEAAAVEGGEGADFKSQTRIARISFEAKLYDKALEELRDIRARHGPKPELLEMTRECATQLMKHKRLEEAKMFCNAALQMEPTDGETLLALGRLERQLGNRDAAERNLRLAMKYGGDSNVEKELREVLSMSRNVETSSAGVLSPLSAISQLNFSMILGYAPALVATGALIFGASWVAFNAVGGSSVGAAAAGAAILVLSALCDMALAVAFSGPIAQFKDRLVRVRQFAASQGYAGGWLVIGGVSIAVWWLYQELISGAGGMGDTFILVFGIPCWALSIPVSWFLVLRALREQAVND
jgi:serine/threonine protein kinase